MAMTTASSTLSSLSSLSLHTSPRLSLLPFTATNTSSTKLRSPLSLFLSSTSSPRLTTTICNAEQPEIETTFFDNDDPEYEAVFDPRRPRKASSHRPPSTRSRWRRRTKWPRPTRSCTGRPTAA
ncbi:hypothetical protein M0R45_013241 [Rubus argutus]|uniref:Uncharacterized protein n=1 Tax=Rubus argutus TaxID=59490 RepID=A0AAW1XIK5_RUBAR